MFLSSGKASQYNGLGCLTLPDEKCTFTEQNESKKWAKLAHSLD